MIVDGFSTVRLFVLGILEHKPTHGYEIVSTGERWAIHRWASITIGAIYAAIRRLEKEKWICAGESEKEGKRPEKQIWHLTEHGREGLLRYIRHGLSSLNFEGREVDVAMVFATLLPPQERIECVKLRLEPLAERLKQLEYFDRSYEESVKSDSPDLTEFKRLKQDYPWIHCGVRHGLLRIRAEIAWVESLISEIGNWPVIVAAVKS